MKSLPVKLGVILIGLVICGCAEVWGEDWKHYGDDEKFSAYYDVQSITRPSKNIVRVWLRWDWTEKGVIVMCKALDTFGPKEILNILVENARQDDIILQLLVQFPTVVSLSEFLHTLPTIKVSKRIFKKLQRKGYVI